MDARPGPSADLTATPRADHSERYRPEPARGYTFPSGSRGSLKNCRWRLAANADADLNDPDWVRRSPRGSSVHYYALQHQRLCSVWRRHFEYFGLPSNLHRLTPSIRRRVAFGIARSSLKPALWERRVRLLERFPSPPPHITYPRPM